MDFLFVGGTGTISSAITALAVQQGHNVTLINRGQQKTTPPGGVRTIVADINDERAVAAALGNQEFSAVSISSPTVPSTSNATRGFSATVPRSSSSSVPPPRIRNPRGIIR